MNAKWQYRKDLGAPGFKPRVDGRGTTGSQGIHERDWLMAQCFSRRHHAHVEK